MNEHLLDRVAEATSLREGTTGVAQVLRIVHQEGKVTLRDLSHRLGLPIPVLAAVRGELEKATRAQDPDAARPGLSHVSRQTARHR
jgi:hypothetical protein